MGHQKTRKQTRQQDGFSLVEVMIALMVLGIAIIPVITTIQTSRVRLRSISNNIVGQTLAVSVMEMVKRAGFTNNNYGSGLPVVLSTSTAISTLLDFPRLNAPPHLNGVAQNNLPPGAPGGATQGNFQAFLDSYTNQSQSMQALAQNAVITSDTNYYFFSGDQIAEVNGYSSFSAVPSEKRQSLLDPQYAWGYFVASLNGPDGAAGTLDDLRRVAVIIKWIDTRRSLRQFTVLESYTVSAAPRLTRP